MIKTHSDVLLRNLFVFFVVERVGAFGGEVFFQLALLVLHLVILGLRVQGVVVLRVVGLHFLLQQGRVFQENVLTGESDLTALKKKKKQRKSGITPMPFNLPPAFLQANARASRRHIFKNGSSRQRQANAIMLHTPTSQPITENITC